jgi:nicotinate-nucleotide adenylyltransferase
MGGTFDPPHIGHLLAASDACDLLDLDQLVFIPAWQQPLKQHVESTPANHRLRMVQLMAEGDPRFLVDEIEIRRTGLSFTVDTLEEYAGRYPDSVRYLLLGVDAFALLEQWREAGKVVSLAHLVVMARQGGDGLVDNESVMRKVRAVGGAGAATPRALESRRIDVSSTEIRTRVKAGQSIRGFVTEPVAQYIEFNGLYR